MLIRFTHLQGTMDIVEFDAMMNMTRLRQKTRKKLEQFFVDGIAYSQIPGSSRQFIYKKLVELETKGLIEGAT